MNAHPVQLLDPCFQFLDKLIREEGDILYMLLVYIAVPLVVWLLVRRCGRKQVRGSHTFVLIVRPPTQLPPVPPLSRWNLDAPDDDIGPFAE
jgi:hypothetical protein